MKCIELRPSQAEAVKYLDSGDILCGGVGTGKSITSLAYYYIHETGGSIGGDGVLHPPEDFVPLYIITTARKRDTFEWEKECERFDLSKKVVTVDSWNNIGKYADISDAFFIFDEQRVVGSGAWVRSYLKIAKKNRWILLSATPGDTWTDYIPVFIANGFYKNRTEFLKEHCVYSRFTKYPKIDRYVGVRKLEKFRDDILVNIEMSKHTVPHYIPVQVTYNEQLFKEVLRRRWDPYKDAPIQDAGGLCYILRKIVNSDWVRLEAVRGLLKQHDRMIIFYNYDYELDMLRELSEDVTVAEWNGHKHDDIPKCRKWAYLVQYTAGAEGWNCIETNALIFFSQSYSYKAMVQASGRIDRMNTPYTDLYYYTIKSVSPIDVSIGRALKNKKNFNEKAFCKGYFA